MAASPDRRELVARLVEDRWDSEDEFDQFFAITTDPEELHLFAYHFNMGTGVGELWKVVRHPFCDRGTLLLIYWRLSPGFFYAAEHVDRGSRYERDQHDLLREVERRYLAGEYGPARIRFDPRQFRGGDLLAANQEYGDLHRLPPLMLEPSPGELVRPLWGR
jgi:hypothetical protein